MGDQQTGSRGDIAEMRSQIHRRADKLEPSIEKAQSFEEIFGDINEDDSGKLENFERVDTAVAFFAVASELLDTYTDELFVQRIIDDEFRENDSVKGKVVINQLSREGKYDILRHFEILDKKTNSDIEEVVNFRDSLVHDPEKVFQRKISVCLPQGLILLLS
ncbi:hypothetical protein ACODNH_01615 (plasmid) [Haloarcula sp. NS06]|uniref:hypothetical protein n=1 Tax=Haloarcula sp. NS06 TaxID=3409688 RepID=UPI003DA72EB8